MEDHKAITVEAQGGFKFVKSKMQEFTNQMMFLKEQVVYFLVLLFMIYFMSWSINHI
jgi:hypothetical protein